MATTNSDALSQMGFSVIFDHAPNMMLLVDKQLRVRRANQALLEFIDNDAASVANKGIGEIFPCINCLDGLRECGESPECAGCQLTGAIRETFQTQERQRGASVSLRISSGPREGAVELLLSATPVVVGGEELQLVSFEDVTSRKQAEDALLRSSEFQRQILNTAATAVFTVDNELRVTSVNEEFTTITGFAPDDVVGEHCSVLRGTPCQNNCGVFDPDNNGSVYRQQCNVTSKDGRRLDIIKNANLTRDESGKVTGAIESFVDVTELVASRQRAEAARREIEDTNKQLENAVERANKMALAAELASQAKSEFLANMSHEIRTPMNGVLGMTDLLLDTDMDNEQRDYAETVKGSAEALLTLINDILDFSKIEAGKLALDPIDFSLSDNMHDTVNSFALRAAELGLELACYVEPDVPDSLVGDPGRLRQIIVNLIGNAMKFTKQGEVVLRVEVETAGDDHVVLHFSVTDTGIGVPEEKKSVIFEVFSQADGSTTREFGGTGLGLTISSQLVNMMKGRIWVESPASATAATEENPGAVFHFTARFGVQAEAESGEDGQGEEIPEGLDALVVDDNATSLGILVEILESWNLGVTAVSNGRDALGAIERRIAESGTAFPVIILDVLMPGMDGFALAERIKGIPLCSDSTLIMLISAGQRGDVARCRELAVAAYLAKPCLQSDLRQAMANALHRKKAKGKKEEGPITRHSLREQRQALRILLAEDNPVNQKLALRLLEKRGYSVTVANNGRQAAEAHERNLHRPFDVVLMDVQMPEMDGFEATAAIRATEVGSGRYTPIVAMTAHAMQGYRERCLDSGMDGYVTKPIIADVMFETIESLAAGDVGLPQVADLEIPLSVPEPVVALAPSPPAQASVAKPASMAADASDGADDLPVFERDVALARAADDEELLRELAGMFLEDAPELLAEIEGNMAKGDLKVAERHAHSLKGASANLGAEALRQVAFEMEVANREGRPEDERARLYDRLAREYARLREALEVV